MRLASRTPASRSQDPSRPQQAAQPRYSRKYQDTTASNLRYSIACIWARDARLRASDGDKAWEQAIAHLSDAVEVNAGLLAYWQQDPDFKDMPAARRKELIAALEPDPTPPAAKPEVPPATRCCWPPWRAWCSRKTPAA